MVTLLIISLLVAIPVTGLLVLKSVQLGLRWQIETKEAKPPTMESPIKPIVEVVQRKQEQKQVELAQNVFDEWVNGAKEVSR